MEQEQPLDLSLTESNYSNSRVCCVTTTSAVSSYIFMMLQVKTPLDVVQKMFPYLKQTNTGTLVLWNFLWAILENNHTNIAA